MRVSTSMMFDAGASSINRQTADLMHLQQQVSTGRRVVTPSDDPVAAARALEVQQARDTNSQFTTNQSNAKSSLNLEESQLSNAVDLLARVKELAVQAGNSPLSANDRKAIANELRTRYDELAGIANTSDGTGQYLFSGYMGTTKPFAGSVDAIVSGTASDITYQGDDGQRMLQVSAGRFLPISDAGSDVFMRARNGNGTFTTSYAASNTGTGIIGPGDITDPSKWNASNKNFNIVFSVDTATPPVTRYDIIDTTTNTSVLTGSAVPPATPTANQRVYHSGDPINLKSQGSEPAFDFGATVSVSGDPANGDSFGMAPSTNQSLFKTLANLIGTLEAGTSTSPAAQAKFSADVSSALTNIAQGQEGLLQVRTAVGARLSELDTLDSVTSDLDVQYQQTLSNLQDLDWAKALTDLTKQQTQLQAASQSFTMISKLSLFSYL